MSPGRASALPQRCVNKVILTSLCTAERQPSWKHFDTDTITWRWLFPPVNSMEFQMQKDSWRLRTNLAVTVLDHGWLLAWKFIHMTWEYNTWHKIYRGCHAPIPDKGTAVTDGGTRHLSCYLMDLSFFPFPTYSIVFGEWWFLPCSIWRVNWFLFSLLNSIRTRVGINSLLC